jgi:hypothetical protein
MPSPRLRSLLALPTAVLLSFAALTACSSEEPGATSTQAAQSAEPSPEAESTPSPAEVGELSYPGEDGRTALDLLLKADPSAVVEGEGEMAFVTSVGGRDADPDTEFWALYVDGEPAQVGAGSLETKSGQTITWKLEEIE